MKIDGISPIAIRHFVAPLLHAHPPTKSNKTKSKTAPKVKSLNESLTSLESELTTLPVAEPETPLTPPQTHQEQEKIKDPDYDPEFDMAEERFGQSKSKPTKEQFVYQPSQIYASRLAQTQRFRTVDHYMPRKNRLNNDRFTYFTLIETLLIHHVLFNKLPEGKHAISFSIVKIHQNAQQLETTLQITQKKKPICSFKIIYDIKKSLFYIYESTTNKKLGEINFHLVGQENYVELATGHFDGHTISIDPVWDKRDASKIQYQLLKIGHRQLDLTPISKGARVGQWSFQGLEPPIPFQVRFGTYKTKKDHIETRKNIHIGKSKLSLILKFINDKFPEPYKGKGSLSITHSN